MSVWPLASDGRHQRRMRAADRDFRKVDFRADETLGRAGMDIAGFDLDRGAELFEHHEEKIDRPRADGAAAGQRHARLAHARDERRNDPKARPHFRDEIIRAR